MLGDGEREPVGIDLLERIGADQRLRHLRGDRHQRDRIEARVGDGREEVGGSRAGGGQTDGGPAGHPRHALRDEAGALFMAGEDVADAAAVQRIVERQDGPAGDAGERVDSLPFEQEAEDGGSSVFHGWWRLAPSPVHTRRGHEKAPSGAAPEGAKVVQMLRPLVARRLRRLLPAAGRQQRGVELGRGVASAPARRAGGSALSRRETATKW